MARIGRPDILWSVNKLARSITKWTKACDERLNRLISLHSSLHVNTNSIVMWVILQNNADWDCFKTPILRGILRTQNLFYVRWNIDAFLEHIHHTCEYKQYCYVGNTAKQCRPGLFQDSDFAGDLEDSKSTSGGTLCVFGSYTFVPKSWMCKRQTSVSHSSTESEIISLDAGLRLDTYSRSCFMGSDCFSPWKHKSEP